MNDSLVYLKEPQSGDLVEASLCDEVTDGHLRLRENGWVPETGAHRRGYFIYLLPESE